ncbi:hypothetical protein Pan241w_09910 [Gimesia alba]|uniref:Cytochrome c domain-containing protein n=1 Tax=Gimesia alba TaxID=2527973 RepID=A0A517RAL7_9PLAN|nr:hypothetical protein [Gimesia alba]QDT40932.1 hypothetical protein Pan241w_09910 [Gimesia alba]
MNVFHQNLIALFTVILLQSPFAEAAPPLNFEAAPVNYSDATPQNVITQLQRALDTGEKKWEYADDFGYLLPLLKDLKISISSQMLPFSKTSLQRHLIGPDRPRALYFNDDAYVGYVQDGMLELMVTDEKLGMVFYTLKQTPAKKPQLQRQVASCMTCHASTRTKNIPGLLVRSMFVDPVGLPVISAGSFRTDHSSPLSERWGGWYVTGTHGKTTHMGNFHLASSKRPKKPIENKTGLNLKNLSSLKEIAHYPSPHSDLVALMVFEHQIDAHNFIIRTNYAWQIDVHNGDTEQEDAVWKQEVEQLVKYLLFEKEAKLEFPIQGTSSFATEFAKQGPFDSQGRSLRQFDLERRLFQFPCSYMIYSKAFRSLAEPVRTYVYQRLKGVISGDDESLLSQKMSESDRQNLAEILPATIPELKQVWERMGSSASALVP